MEGDAQKRKCSQGAQGDSGACCNMLDGLADPVLVLSKALMITQFNRAAAEQLPSFLGCELEVDKPAFEAMPKREAAEWGLRCQESLNAEGGPWELVLDGEGGTRTYRVRAKTASSGGKVNDCLVLHFSDYTKDKQRELEQKVKFEEMRDALETRSTLLSMISHDLRSPIFQLNGLLFMIRRATEERDESRILMYAEDLEERTLHLTHTIDNVLSWSSLQRNALKPRVSQFNFKEELKHIIGLCRPLSLAKGIHVSTEDVDADLEVESDRQMVAFILRNLLANAIKFSPEGGKVTVGAGYVGKTVQFSVADNGIGFAPGELDDFRSGKQGSGRLGTHGERGSGLGLKLSKQFAEILQGSINFISAKGEGTVATVRVPFISRNFKG